MITLLNLKERKAALRNLMTEERKAFGSVCIGTFSAYQNILAQLRVADFLLLKKPDALGLNS